MNIVPVSIFKIVITKDYKPTYSNEGRAVSSREHFIANNSVFRISEYISNNAPKM